MKGVVFNLLQDVVVDAHGADAWDDLLDAAGLDGAYTSLGNYPDSQMQALVAAAAQALHLDADAVLRWFGQRAMPRLARRYPGFFEGHADTRSFLLSLNSIIHPEVRKIYPGADVPVFDFQDGSDGALLMGYLSPRRLCALAQGFAEGAANHFGESLEFTHIACMHHGDPRCLFHIVFHPAT